VIDFGTAMTAKVTSPCSRVDPQLKQPLRDDLLRHDDFFIRVLECFERFETAIVYSCKFRI